MLLARVRRRVKDRRVRDVVRVLAPQLRGWVAYFRLSEVRGTFFEALAPWFRRRLRALLWRQWKRRRTRLKELRRRGLEARRAACSATDGRGPYWKLICFFLFLV